MNESRETPFGTTVKAWIVPVTGMLLLVSVAVGSWGAHGVAAQEELKRQTFVSTELQTLRRDIKRIERVEQQRSTSMADVSHDEKGASQQSLVLTPAEGESPKQPSSWEEQRATAQSRQQELVASVQARFASEEVDQDWRSATVGRIKGVLGVSTPGTRLVEVDCASSVCRAVVVHDSDEARRSLASEIASSEPFNHGVLYSYDRESEPPKTLLFVRREGTTFGEDGESP